MLCLSCWPMLLIAAKVVLSGRLWLRFQKRSQIIGYISQPQGYSFANFDKSHLTFGMKYILLFLLLIAEQGFAQKISRSDKRSSKALQNHITYLADDKLEGRRTGTPGEKLAYNTLLNSLKGPVFPAAAPLVIIYRLLKWMMANRFLPETVFSVNNQSLSLNEDFFLCHGLPMVLYRWMFINHWKKKGEIWFYDLNELLNQKCQEPALRFTRWYAKMVAEQAKKELPLWFCTIVLLYPITWSFEPKDKTETASIPVIYITQPTRKKYLADEVNMLKLKLAVSINTKTRTGHNVVAFLNNNASNTVIIGAHYDHLGYGEDHNSLYSGSTPMIHNGADDNASGTAALIELSKLLQSSDLKSNNYLIIAFSGEELGLFGSKYFTDHPTISMGSVNYMIIWIWCRKIERQYARAHHWRLWNFSLLESFDRYQQ